MIFALTHFKIIANLRVYHEIIIHRTMGHKPVKGNDDTRQ
jgi:hypothetical protein